MSPSSATISILLSVLSLTNVDALSNNQGSEGGPKPVVKRLSSDPGVPECGADLNCDFRKNRHLCAKIYYTKNKGVTGLPKDFWEATEQPDRYHVWAQRSSFKTNASWCISLEEAYEYSCQGNVVDRPCDCDFYDCVGTDLCDFMKYDMNNEAKPWDNTYVQDCYRSCCDVSKCKGGGGKSKKPLMPEPGAPKPPKEGPKEGPKEKQPVPDTASKTSYPTAYPSPKPTPKPTLNPTLKPTPRPTPKPTLKPTLKPTEAPTNKPTSDPTPEPTPMPSPHPTPPTPLPTPAPTSPPTHTRAKVLDITKGKNMKCERNRHVGKVDTVQEYKISFDITPSGVVHSWSNIFHFIKDGADGIHAGKGSRLPALFFYPGSTRLHFRSETSKDKNAGCDPKEALIRGVNYHVELIAVQGVKHSRFIVRLNGFTKCHIVNEATLAKGEDNVHLYLSDPWYPAAKAMVKNFKYEKLPILKPNVNLLAKMKTPMNLHDGTILGKFEQGSINFDLRIKIKPTGTVGTWANIVHMTDDVDINWGNRKKTPPPIGARIPAVWFYPGTTRLHFRMSDVQDANNGCDPLNPLEIGKEYDIVFTCSAFYTSVKINGKQVCYSRFEAVPVAGVSKQVWLSNAWYAAAKAEVSSLVYTPHTKEIVDDAGKPLMFDTDLLAGKDLSPQMSYLGEIDTLTQYKVSLELMIHGTQPGWTNIFHFTKGKNTKNGGRIPALWLYPGSTRLHFRAATTKDNNAGCDPMDNLVIGKKYKLEFLALKGPQAIFIVKIDGEQKCLHQPAGKLYPASKGVQVWAGDKWYPGANVTMSKLVYSAIPQLAHGVDLLASVKDPKLAKQGTFLGDIPTSKSYKLSFNFRPKGTTPSWGSIVHLTAGGDAAKNNGRVPGVWMYGNSLKMHVRVETSAGNEGCDPSEPLTLNKNHRIEVIVVADKNENAIAVNIDGKSACYYRLAGSVPVKSSNVHVYAPDPWYSPANGVVTKLAYEEFKGKLHTELSPGLDLLGGSVFKPAKGRMLGKIDTTSEYKLSFDLVAKGTTASWGSILHFTTGKDSSRIPGLWFYPKTLQLHWRTAVFSDSNHGCDPDPKAIQIGKKHHIDLIAVKAGEGNSHLIMEIDGKQECYVETKSDLHGGVKNAQVWVSDPWYDAAEAEISNLIYRPIPKLNYEKELLGSKQLVLRRGNLLGKIDTFRDFRMSFEITVAGVTKGTWTSIVHMTTGHNIGKKSSRIPGFWLWPGSSRLHFRTSTFGNHNDGCDPAVPLTLGAKHFIEVNTVSQDAETIFEVKVDGKHGCYARSSSSSQDAVAGVQVWAADPWYPAAKATIGNLQYGPATAKFKKMPTLNYGRDMLDGKAMLVGKGTLLGKIETKTEYTLSFDVTPHSTHPMWNGIVKFMSSKGDHKAYGRNPGIWFFPGSTRLHLRSGTDKNWNEGCDPTDMLTLNKKYSISFTVLQGSTDAYFITKINGKQKCFHKSPGAKLLAGKPGMSVYASSSDYDAAIATIEKLVYTAPPMLASGSDLLGGKTMTLEKGTLLGRIKTFEAYKLSFEITPTGVQEHWSSIVHMTKNDNAAKAGDRIPAIWFYPGSTRLHLRTATSVGGANDGCDPSINLQLNKKVKVEMIVSPGASISVKIQGKEVCYKRLPVHALHPAEKSVMVYAADPWYAPAKAEISKLVYSRVKQVDGAKPLVVGKDFLQGKVTKPAQGAELGHFTSLNEYVVSFDVNPSGVINGAWSSLFNIAELGRKDGQPLSRIPGVWFYPSSTRLHWRTSLDTDYNAGCDPSDVLSAGRNYSVKLVTMQGRTPRMMAFLDGDMKCIVESARGNLATASKAAHVYAGHPNYQGANAEISRLTYNPLPALQADNNLLGPKAGEVRLKKGNFLGVISTSTSYKLSFELTLFGRVSSWGSVLHFSADSNIASEHDRIPGIWTFPGDTRLHFRSATSGNYNDGCDPTMKLELNKKYRIQVSADALSNTLSVKINHKQVCSSKASGLLAKGHSKVFVWAADPWYEPANGQIAQVYYRKF
eukprot:jgi/Bigna1/76348/fgenesh1_pg.40_\